MLKDEKQDTQFLDIRETAHFLEISSATVRNWMKHDYISPATTEGRTRFALRDVRALKKNLLNGSIDRLRKRANKNRASSTFLPLEYLTDDEKIKDTENILSIIHAHEAGVEEGLFIISLKMLACEGLITTTSIGDLLNPGNKCFSHRQVKKEIEEWAKNISFKPDKLLWEKIMAAHIPKVNDFLGVVYQSLSTAGNKSKAGAYYTPPEIVDKIIEDHLHEARARVLDPCCGTGQFLLFAVDRLSRLGNNKPMENVWGCDIDPVAVKIARLNLLMRCKDQDDFSPHIYCLNPLLEGIDIFSGSQKIINDNYFDLVMTNPPWGARISRSEIPQLDNLFAYIKSGESFSYFLAKGMDLLKEGGFLSYILPESVLNVKMHGDIREYLLKKYTIKKIMFLDRAFKNVFTPVIRVDIQKKCPPGKHGIEVQNGKAFVIEQSSASENPNLEISITTDNKDAHILNKIFSQKHTTLANNAEWALGIVTGNNKKFLSEQEKEGYEAIIRGKDVMKFVCQPAQCFLKFEPGQFQQVAPEYKYRAKEKLIYRFISKKLVFAYDDKQVLTLNSANILIPGSSKHTTKIILGLFNSSLYQFIFQKKFNSIKILRSHIEALPLPDWSEISYKNISSLVDRLLNPDLEQEHHAHLFAELDKYIMSQWGLTESEMAHVQNADKHTISSL